jgi:hypothetical protein
MRGFREAWGSWKTICILPVQALGLLALCPMDVLAAVDDLAADGS